MATIKDVAKLAGVNPALVSRVVNNDPTLSIRDDTRERIINAISELNYKANSIARSLRMKVSKTIAVIVADISNPYYVEVIKGAQKAASEKGYNLVLFDTEEDAQKERDYIDIIVERCIDGVILTSVYIEDNTIELLKKHNLQYVFVHRTTRSLSGSCVTADDIKGVMLSVQHLAAEGHTKIAHLAGLLYTEPGLQRLEGYRKSLMKYGLEFRSDYVVEAGFNEKGGYNTMKKLLYLDEPPSAVIAANDLVALGAMRAIIEQGLKIPDDISIIGFDDIWVSQKINPPLTTVKYNIYEIGYTAAQMLIKKISKESLESETVIMDVELNIRGSTANYCNQGIEKGIKQA